MDLDEKTRRIYNYLPCRCPFRRSFNTWVHGGVEALCPTTFAFAYISRLVDDFSGTMKSSNGRLLQLCRSCRRAYAGPVKNYPSKPIARTFFGGKAQDPQNWPVTWLLGGLVAGGGGLLYLNNAGIFRFHTLYAEAPPAPADVVLEETKKRKNASKEDNRALISSQHLQVKRSWDKPGVYVWGSNVGRVCDPTSEEPIIKNPRRIPFFDGQILRDLKLDRNFAAAIAENGDLCQWGIDYAHDIKEPARTLVGKDLVSVVLSNDRIIALSSSGTVFSIPVSRDEQQNGAKLKESSWVPFWSSSPRISYRTIKPTLSAFDRITAIASGLEHLLMLTSSGRVFSAVSSSTSFPSRGQLGIPGLTWQTRPAGAYDQPHELATLGGFKIQTIVAGDLHSMALDTEGRVFAFGDNSLGQLGQPPSPEATAIDAPSLLPTSRLYAGSGYLPKVTAIAAGGTNSYFLVDGTRVAQSGDGEGTALAAPLGRVTADAWACGGGILGQLGAGRWTHIQGTPVKIKALSGLFEYDETTGAVVPIRVARLSVGATHAAAVLRNITYLDSHEGTADDDTNWGADVLWWAGNEHWQLGTGKRNNCDTPVYIGPLGTGEGKGKREEHRLHITPRKKIQLGGRQVSVEQRVECGRFVSAVYSGT